ncbi:MAG: TrmH family RNA methyltransferase [Thermodesulfobacteriota bacterium]
MDTFGFTQKKFLSQSYENRQKHIIQWLSGFYNKLTTNRVNKVSLDYFTEQYNQVLSWIGMQAFIRPEADITRLWIEAVSDRVHFHRSCTGKPIRDYDLLEKIQTRDSEYSRDSMNINCHIALDGMRSLFNTGSIFRTCEAAGFNSIILGNTQGKEHPGVQKTAMGAHKWIEQEKTSDLAQNLLDKKENGFQIVGVETMEGSFAFNDFAWQRKTILVFGNEEYGISSHVMAVCDEIVHIPMFGRKNSLNVANAVSVICFHIAGCLN